MLQQKCINYRHIMEGRKGWGGGKIFRWNIPHDGDNWIVNNWVCAYIMYKEIVQHRVTVNCLSYFAFTLITSFMLNHSKCGTFHCIPIRCNWAKSDTYSLDSSVWANSIRNKGICKRGSRNNTAQIWFSSQTDDVVHELSRYSSVYSIVKIRIFFKV